MYSSFPFLRSADCYTLSWFFYARLSNSSTFRGWLESTGLDDILVIGFRIIKSVSIKGSARLIVLFSPDEHLWLHLWTWRASPSRYPGHSGGNRWRGSADPAAEEQKVSRMGHYLQIELVSSFFWQLYREFEFCLCTGEWSKYLSKCDNPWQIRTGLINHSLARGNWRNNLIKNF